MRLAVCVCAHVSDAILFFCLLLCVKSDEEMAAEMQAREIEEEKERKKQLYAICFSTKLTHSVSRVVTCRAAKAEEDASVALAMQMEEDEKKEAEAAKKSGF